MADRILPGVASVMEINLQVVADVDPQMFPEGLDVVIFRPGKPEPLGSIRIPRACMLLCMPPSPKAEQMRQHMRQAMAQQRRAGPGEVKAPGL